MRILICDDNGKIVNRWAKELDRVLRKLQITFEIHPLSEPAQFWQQISMLEGRRKDARGRRRKPLVLAQTEFDNADIVIVDYDLMELSQVDDQNRGYVTGESVAYLCRCYSKCGLIVALNQFGSNPFDLTLKGHPESYADLNLGSDQLANPGLWSDKWSGFRPWHWPVLPQACVSFRNRTEALLDKLQKSVLEHLGFRDDVGNSLPRATAQFLGPQMKPQETTFEHFVLSSGHGLELKDKPLSPEFIARIAGARLGKWLEKLVLPGQDILIDAPHLASRFPSLLKGNIKNQAAWNKTTAAKLSKLGLRTEKLEKNRFKPEDWLSRPAWFWTDLSKREDIEEVKNPWASKGVPDFVFCEDVSRFLPRDMAREFVAGLPSNFARRYVVNHNSRLGKKYKLGKVQYAPSVRFSL